MQLTTKSPGITGLRILCIVVFPEQWHDAIRVGELNQPPDFSACPVVVGEVG